MRVGLDQTPLTVATGGIRRYTEQLFAALVDEFPDEEFELIGETRDSWLARRWWSLGLPRKLWLEGVDVFHGTDFSVPYYRVCPSVMTVHDLSPWGPEDWRAESGRVRSRTPILLWLGRASMVITPTEAVRREVLTRFRQRPERVVAIHLAPSAIFTPDPPFEPRYFLIVASAGARKNLALAVAAWQAAATGYPLVIVGRGDFGIPLEPGLEFRGAVPDDELPALYRGARALLMPSHYEGFGLPMVEAFACGAPVIASRDPALLEVSDGAAVHVDARDESDGRLWTEAIRAMAQEPAIFAAGREAGLRRARAFSWRKTARKTFAVYEEAWRRWYD